MILKLAGKVCNCQSDAQKFRQQLNQVTWLHIMIRLCIQALKVSLSAQNFPYPASLVTYANVSWDYRLMRVREIWLLRRLSLGGVVMVLAVNQTGAFVWSHGDFFSTSVSIFLEVREAILTTSLRCRGHVWRNTDILCLPTVFAGLRKVSGEVENVWFSFHSAGWFSCGTCGEVPVSFSNLWNSKVLETVLPVKSNIIVTLY